MLPLQLDEMVFFTKIMKNNRANIMVETVASACNTTFQHFTPPLCIIMWRHSLR